LNGVFVTGTGTEVGKTVVAAAIAHTLAAEGNRVAVFKPAVTGLDPEQPTDRTKSSAIPRISSRRRGSRDWLG
jgi:dethiobiotin synthetase